MKFSSGWQIPVTINYTNNIGQFRAGFSVQEADSTAVFWVPTVMDPMPDNIMMDINSASNPYITPALLLPDFHGFLVKFHPFFPWKFPYLFYQTDTSNDWHSLC